MIVPAKEKRLRDISNVEQIELTDDAMTDLLDVANGDLRRAVNYLQTAVNVIPKDPESPDSTRTLQSEHVDMVAVRVSNAEVCDVFETALHKDFDQLKCAVDNLAYEAYSCADILTVLLELVVQSVELSAIQKAYIMDKIGETDGALVDGSDEFLQLLNVFTYVQGVKKCK